jgi:hypothetical protein
MYDNKRTLYFHVSLFVTLPLSLPSLHMIPGSFCSQDIANPGFLPSSEATEYTSSIQVPDMKMQSCEKNSRWQKCENKGVMLIVVSSVPPDGGTMRHSG